MTDIYIPPQNELSCEDDVVSTSNTSENNATAIQGGVFNNTLATDEANKKNPITKEILTVTINVSTNKKTDKESNPDVVTARDCPENANIDTEIKDNDQVIKYVYNKTDKNDIIQKKIGHFKNSLKRRKRSANKQMSKEDAKAHESKRAPLIVDYETSHKPSHLDVSQFSSTAGNVKNSNLRISQEPSHIEIEFPTHQQTTGNVIKNSHLADFNIETLHEKEDNPKRNNENLKSEIEIVDTSKTKYSNLNSEENNRGDRQTLRDSEESVEGREYNDSNESRESDGRKDYSSNVKQSNRVLPSKTEYTSFGGNNDKKIDELPNNYRDNKRPIKTEYNNEPKSYSEREESNEKIIYPNNPPNSQDNFESNEKSNFKQDKNVYSDQSEENYRPKEKRFHFSNDLAHQKISTERPELEESNESDSKGKESYETDSSEASKYSRAENNSDESAEKYINHSKPYRKDHLQSEKKEFDNEKPYNLQYNTENSNESKEHKDSYEYDKNEPKNQTKSTKTSSKIQDVDLGDFSYERIEVNDKGQVVPARDSYEENLPLTPKSENFNKESNEKLSSSQEDSISHSSTESNEDKGLVRINDGEIKPVVEINGDNNSDEFISKEPINSNLKIKDQSLEEFLDIKELHKNDQREKLKIEEKDDVKQQVERIPLNYEHDKSNDHHENRQQLTTEKDLSLKTQVEVSEGTIEIIPTDSPKYDENLKFKFDDVTVSLPEIKLPEDILAYAYEEPQYQKQKKQKDEENKNDSQFYRYGSLNSDEDDKNRRPHDDHDTDTHRNHDDDDYDKYYGNYKQKDNYRKINDDDAEEEEEDDHADLYEKFVRERFGKRGTFEQRSEKLQNSRPVADPHLYQRIKNVLKKTHDIDKQAQKSGDPNAGYMWTLEYGQKL